LGHRIADRAAYFLSHLIPGDVTDATGPFEIQVLNDVGQGVAVAYFSAPGDIVIDGHVVPPAVVVAATTLPIGFGYYVNAGGAWVDPWGMPTIPMPSDREQLAEMLLETAQRLIDTRVPGGELRIRAVVEYYSGTKAAQKAIALLNSGAGRG
jgi:hypothetical protein